MKNLILLSLGVLFSATALAQENYGPPEISVTQSQTDPGKFAENNQKLARPEFFDVYSKANMLLTQGSIDEAEQAIEQLEAMEDKNDFEQAYSALVRYNYATQSGNAALETRSLAKVVEKGAKHLDSDFYASAGMSLLKFQIQNKQYGEAVLTVDSMKKNKKSQKGTKKNQ